MHRRDFLKAGLALGVAPLTRLSPDELPYREDARKIADAMRAEHMSEYRRTVEFYCEQALELQLNGGNDPERWDSLELLQEAARGEHSFAQWMLSTRYWEGWRAPIRKPEALELSHKAAEAGEFIAQLELALRYDAGCGVPESPTQAEHWWNRAAHHQIHRPMADVDRIAPTPEEAAGRCWDVWWNILRAANRVWGKEAAAGEQRWHTSDAAQPVADLARLKLDILRAKRTSGL